MSSWKPAALLLSASAAILMACGAGFEDGYAGADSDPAADEGATDDGAMDELSVDDAGVVLGTTWQELSYPTCQSAASDPDRDGWGWENNMSCIVKATSGSTQYPTCQSASSDPDGDGWGWENKKSCIVKGSSVGNSGGTSGSCANLEGTASTMAALAVSVAMELKRWQPVKDFAIVNVGGNEMVQLTAAGKARCSDGKCFNTQALLDFQKNDASGKITFPSNVTLNSGALRSRLVAKFRDQIGCEKQPSNGGTTNCPAEDHQLTFQRSEKGGCDTNYFFVAKGTDGKALKFPAQLKNKLLWADPRNPYVAFQSVGEVVSVDPTYGLNEQGSTSTGTCTAACTKISASNQEGGCCSCAGLTKKFVKAPWNAATFICQ